MIWQARPGALVALVALSGATLAAPAALGAQRRSGHARAHQPLGGRAFEPGADTRAAPAAVIAGAQGGQPCDGEAVPPYSACVVPYAVSAGESRLIAADGEAGDGSSATVCVYLSARKRGLLVWNGSPVSCNTQPTLYTHGYAGQPTIYNDSGRWITAGFADLH